MEFMVQKDFDSVDLSAIKILIMGGGYLSPEMYDEVLRHGLILLLMIHQYMRHQFIGQKYIWKPFIGDTNT